MTHKHHSKVLIPYTLASTLTCVSAFQPAFAELKAQDQDKIQAILQRMALRYQNMEAAQKPVAGTVPAAQQSTSSMSILATEPADANMAQPLQAAQPAQSDNILTDSDERFAVGEELILGLHLGATPLSDLFAIKSEAKVMVGFMALSEMLQLPIELSKDFTSAKGWIFNEKNTFLLQQDSTKQFSVTVNGQTSTVPSSKVRLMEDDLYIDIDLIGSWFLFAATLDETNLKLVLKTERELPIEARLARQNRRVSALSKPQFSVLPERDVGYAIFSPPLFDATISTTLSDGSQVGSYSVLGAQDLMYLNANYFVSGQSKDLLNNARLTLSKQSADNDLLGPLGGTEIEVGDVQPVRQGLGYSSGLSRGVRLTNTPLTGLQNNKLINVAGDIQNGWDVELYRDGILIGNELGITDGRYEFNDIELVYGPNNFELVMYGPEGQVETRTQSYNIDENAVKQGEARYQASVVELNKSVFNTTNNTLANEQNSGVVSSATFTYGFLDWLSFDSGVTSFQPEQGDTLLNYSVGSSLSIPDIAILGYTTAFDDNGGRGQDYNLRTQVLGNSISLGHSVLDNLSLSNVELATSTERNSAGLTGVLFKNTAVPVSYSGNWNQYKHNNLVVESITNSLGFRTPIGSFSNSITLATKKEKEGELTPVSGVFDEKGFQVATNEAGDGFVNADQAAIDLIDDESVAGALQYRTSIGRFFARFSTSYTVKPEREIVGYNTSFSFPVTENIRTNTGLSYSPLSDRIAADLSLNWKNDDWYLTGRASVDNKDNWSVGLSAHWGFGYAPKDIGFFSEGRSIASSGLVVARVYEDTNNNGKFDPGEKPVEGATVVAQQNSRRSDTNAEGIAVLAGMYNFVKTDVVVERGSLGEQYKMSSNAGVAVTPRRGKMQIIEYPVISTTELEGTVYAKSADGVNEPLAYALLELVDSSGKVVADAQSEFDGYYLFVDLIPGNYKLRIETDFSRRKDFRRSAPLFLKTKGGEIVNGADVLLERTELVNGYATELGSFNELLILKAYWLLLSKSGMNTAKLRPFYMQNDESKKYTLYASFVQEREKAERVCARISARKVNCQLKEMEFKL